jgi:hypothetical protein
MRVMVMIKANKDTEQGAMPSTALLKAMGDFNDELIKAGVMLAGEGLHPSSEGRRLEWSAGNKKAKIVDGPFAEAKEVIAGFWIWNVKSMDDAVSWAQRMPTDGQAGVVEIRPVQETEDFGALMTPELRAQEERQRKEIERQARASSH